MFVFTRITTENNVNYINKLMVPYPGKLKA